MAASRDSIRNVWGERTPYAGEGAWPQRVDENLVDAPERWVPSTCVLCSTGCALEIGVRDGRIVGVRGNPADRVNRGRLGPKGLNGWMANASGDRLTRPLVRRGHRLVPTSWDEAMGLVVEKSRAQLAAQGPGALAFYNSGQLMLEEYYTLATIARAGIATPHLDGNTRLCTATAAMALIESFGCDGDPGCYEDLDVTDTLFLVGHNMAETQTVLFARVLDRLAGPRPPTLVVVDPRRTPTAREADLHLQPRAATNLALMNGLLHLVVARGHADRAFVDAHTVGFAELERTIAAWPPARTAEVTGIPVVQLERAAEILGTTPTLVSTVLQGVYQSNQATAAAVQVNNLHLLRGMIGRPGCTVFQMNGQPSAQNTRECGADGALAAFLNWQNPAHVEALARHWNVHPGRLPDYKTPTHAMQIFRYAETGSVRLLWILGTNPAVSLPDLPRIRRILSSSTLFVVVQDAYLTETAQLADVVLPAAIWGEKTGCITNADRTVHRLQQAIAPPGEARSDLDILLDYARRMELRDQDGGPLVRWRTPEEAFESFKQLTRGRPCDYSGLSYARLASGVGMHWPCNERHPDGAPRLYTDHVFPTSGDDCELYGHDLETGAPESPTRYRAADPRGRAILRAADYLPPREEPDAAYPFWLSTGRNVYHFHTRTKTGRAPELQRAAPDAYVELCASDARELGVRDGDLVDVTSRRASVRVRVRIAELREKHAFLPFHYGSWDHPERDRAANELTLDDWDPVSKQPVFKYAAVRIARAR